MGIDHFVEYFLSRYPFFVCILFVLILGFIFSMAEELAKLLAKILKGKLAFFFQTVQMNPRLKKFFIISGIASLIVFVISVCYYQTLPQWSLSNGVLVISKGILSNGIMPSYAGESDYYESFEDDILKITVYSSAPWFENRHEVTSVILKPGITSIGAGAFSEFTKLDTVQIPSSLQSIGDYSFNNCVSLSSITIYDGVNRIGKRAFNQCSSLKDVHILSTGNYTNLDNANIANGIIGEYAFSDCSSLENFYISPNFKIIEDYAFAECYNLSSVTYSVFNCNLTSIGKSAFMDCTELSFVIPDSLTEIGSGAFENCTALTILSIPAGVSVIQPGTFFMCTSLESVYLHDGLQEIGSYAFSGCAALQHINLPDSVRKISDYAFSECSCLESVRFSNNISSIGECAFVWCDSLTEINIPYGVESIGEHAFQQSGLRAASIPGSVEKISAFTFTGCSGLKTVVLGDGIKMIDYCAFSACSSLSDINIPSSTGQ